MRSLLSAVVFVAAVSITKNATDRVCIEETDQEICDSFHLQCGVTIRMTNYCGEKRNVQCDCPAGESCSMEDLSCR